MATPPIADTEITPLLERVNVAPSGTPKFWQRLLRQHVIILCLVFTVLVEVGAYLQTAPLNKVIEEIICHDFFPDVSRGSLHAPAEDPRCKSAQVQAKLAMLRGWQATFDCIPGILTAIPYGLLSDRYGRKIVLGLALLGLTLGCFWYEVVCWWPDVFPIWLTWFSSAFSLIGGGGAVVTSMIYTIVADVVPDAERATIFFRLSAALLVGEMIASPISANLMERNTWLPIFLGLGSLMLATWFSFVLPETVGLRAIKQVNSVSESSDCAFEDASDRSPLLGNDNNEGDGDRPHWLKSQVSRMRTASHFILGHRHVMLLLFTFLVTTLGRFVQELLMQYMSKRFNWSWSKAAYLLTLRAMSNLVLLLVFLPVCSYLLLYKLSFSANSKDLWLARVSSILLLLGAFTIGFAVNPILLTIGLVIFSLGGGYNILIRSLLTAIVKPEHIGTLYNAIAVTETVGMVFAGPLLSTSFRRGLEMGGAWIGLPFLLAGCLFTTAAIVIFTVRLPNPSST